ncbi:unnamed protein product [Echinostoma caproni]|uniref:MADS-box domain-containing protein n=1 Tax=Echinostoma caproni TaxID=27848 RepID=A0A183B368_9TREM|nr:unnamed protein product [Echinostoma caproni]
MAYQSRELLQFINHTTEDVDCEFSEDGDIVLLSENGHDTNHILPESNRCRKRTHTQAFQPDANSPEIACSPEGGRGSKKMTRGKQKIPIEFIHDRARRYSTFSKRKTGLMKKASELAQLTGAQVLLLIASETKHVYTFATGLLKDIVNLDSGKELIETCLMGPRRNAEDEPTANKQSKSTSAVGVETDDNIETPNFATGLTAEATDQGNQQPEPVYGPLSDLSEHEQLPYNTNTDDYVATDLHSSSGFSPVRQANSTGVQSAPDTTRSSPATVANDVNNDDSPDRDNENGDSPSASSNTPVTEKNPENNCINSKSSASNPITNSLTGILINNSTTNSIDPVQLVLLSHLNQAPIIVKSDAPVVLGGCTVTEPTVSNIANTSFSNGSNQLRSQTPVCVTSTSCTVPPLHRRTLLPKKFG